MAERCYIHGPTTTAGTCPTCDAMQRDAKDAEITRLRARLAEAEKVIKPFAEEAPPVDRHPREDTFIYGNIAESDLRAAARWMVVVPSETLPILHGNGVEDDTATLQAMVEGKPYVDDRRE